MPLTSEQIESIITRTSDQYYDVGNELLTNSDRNYVQMHFQTDKGKFLASASGLAKDKEYLMRMCIRFGMQLKAVLDAQEAARC